MNIPCPVNQPCIDDAASLGNFSSEDPDIFLFRSFRFKSQYWDGYWDPFYACHGYCESAISQQDADECADRNAFLCEASYIRESSGVSASTVCSDGQSRSFSVEPGWTWAFSQSQADAEAQQYAQAYLASVCAHLDDPDTPVMTPIPPKGKPACNDQQTAEAPCASGGVSYVMPAGAYCSHSKSAANVKALSKASEIAYQMACLVEFPESFCYGDNVSVLIAPASLTYMEPPYTWEVVGILPSGLNVIPFSTALRIEGTVNDGGSFTFTATITDSKGSQIWRQYTFTVMRITSPESPTEFAVGDEDQAFSATLAMEGGIAPFSWQLKTGSTLPPGLMLNEETGEISGTPTADGDFDFIVILQDQAT